MEALSAAHARFSLALFGQIRATDATGNAFYSPLGLSAALRMLSLGAAGDTAAQIAQALQVLTDEGELHSAFGALMKELTKAGAPHTLSLANRLYAEQSYQFVPKFLEETTRLYGAELETVDFMNQAAEARVIINAWVKQQTSEMVPELLGEADVDVLTRLVLVNAVYFKGSWEKSFRAEQTQQRSFSVSQGVVKPVQMMFQKARFPLAFIPEVNCQILELPYAGKELSMLVLLPNDPSGLLKLEEALTQQSFSEWTRPDMMDVLEVEVSLPRFRLEESYDMKKLLLGLGMVDAFDARRADFSALSPRDELLLSRVVHQAVVEVTEEGTEAAAGSAAVMMTRCLMRAERFCADHPFLFFIRHNPSRSVLFFGRVCSP